jgi:hypothetical protein
MTIGPGEEQIRGACLAGTKGRWPCGSNEGATISATLDERDSDMGAVYHCKRVRIERTGKEAIGP